MAVISEQPILSRLDRLDNMLRQLEEIRGCCNRSSKSSGASTPTTTSGTLTSEGHVSSCTDVSPRSLEKHCRPIDLVMTEIETKGTLVERLDFVEERMLKLCSLLEGELESKRKREHEAEHKKKKKGLKGLVNKVVKGSKQHKTNDRNPVLLLCSN